MLIYFVVAAGLGVIAGIGSRRGWRNSSHRVWAFWEISQGVCALALLGTAIWGWYNFGFLPAVGILLIGFAAGAISSR